MTEPEFTATGVRIDRWPRSLTRAGEVRVEDGRLSLLTSYGSEIDSAPVDKVRAGRPWFAKPDEAVATVNGTRYRISGMSDSGSGRLLEVLRKSGPRP
ncbi:MULTISPECIES: hypothetical protein [unclassified Streptomyces]|uniref:hypothetical protein n=1 Tax=unclassified Streptomyces TaxID=2593676 RepID=UPI002E36A9E1|nr:hypothetical protein [Streptomyces sp. NBC_01268]